MMRRDASFLIEQLAVKPITGVQWSTTHDSHAAGHYLADLKRPHDEKYLLRSDTHTHTYTRRSHSYRLNDPSLGGSSCRGPFRLIRKLIFVKTQQKKSKEINNEKHVVEAR